MPSFKGRRIGEISFTIMERIRNVRKQFGSISWNYYIRRMDAEWYNSKSEDDDIFKVDLSIGATKSLIPGYVARGISNLKTDAMKESIAQCMKNQGLMDEARLEASYQRALRVLEDTVVAVPDELEADQFKMRMLLRLSTKNYSLRLRLIKTYNF